MSWVIRSITASSLLLFWPIQVHGADEHRIGTDSRFPDYVPLESRELTGNLCPAGSDTLLFLAMHWAEELHKHYPDLKFRFPGRGVDPPPVMDPLFKW